MPLSKRARIEIYLPETGKSSYARLHSFGGCTVIKGIKGLYLGSDGKTDFDRISLLYTDTPFDFDEHFAELSDDTDRLQEAALEATDEESVLLVVHAIYHSIIGS